MSKIFYLLKNPLFWLCLIVLVAFIVRLYKIDNPIADWHSWRQADTAAVARNFYKEGFNPLLPRGDDMSPPGTVQANPERYRFVEFPIYNSLVYFLYLLNGGVDEKLARLVSILMSLGSTVFIYFVTKKYLGVFTGLIASLLFAILPFNIYFSRTTLPEPTLVFFSLGMLYFTDRWIWENRLSLFILAVSFTSLAFLIKPMAGFYLLPLIYSYYLKEQKLWPIPKRYIAWVVTSFVPFVAWRFWMLQHPEGIPASAWLMNGDGIRFRPAFWKWIVGDRFGREILTVAGSILFTIGVLVKPKLEEGKLLHLLVFSSLLYLIVFATGNVTHDYYQTFIVPALVIFTARGFTILLKGSGSFIPRLFTIPLALLLLFLTIYLGWLEVKGLYQINNGAIVEAGKMADQILPRNAVVLAPYMGDTAFLYQVNRPGWPIMVLPIEEMKKKYGVTAYVSVNYDTDTKNLMEKYSVLEENPKFVIIDVSRPK
ncbi:hypothetical protein A2617_04105 [Candidatus Daviesbacteria bacterium RIFOXYD1_FULL_41_10]|uniref:Glycosyltransferase RgtA/B/C/D-like domain-containing protein n=2 Tax=Candidatus Daviesiibacteriota TaxID=1752718 RepID=A0A1F5N0S6_9BACT|nr:MAG: Glycosyl transferase family 39 [Candidatus Daviesbacteria bacterium GW2011_GWB1_41_5]OGE71090.1 MAG: hypothetical protein A2617_04105 [Candidatus Daviesbacteria bacterium RIFOXYD1_FULL_41_10]